MTMTRRQQQKGPPVFQMPKKPHAFTLILAPLVLSGCCIFGYQSTTYSVWESEFPGDSGRIQSICEAEIDAAAEKRTSRFVRLAKEECGKEAPFASIEFVNPSTGVRYQRADIAAGYADALCPDVRASGKLSRELIGRYCSECSKDRYDLERCYKQAGLKRVDRTGFECKPMRLF